MNLPKEFVFVVAGTPWEYTAKKATEGYDVWSSPEGRYVQGYNTVDGGERLEKMLENGTWVILNKFPSKCNGVDAEGNPRNWTKDDFEPFQLVVLRNGLHCLVVPDEESGLAAAFAADGWNDLYTPGQATAQSCSQDIVEEYAVVEVYSPHKFACDAFKMRGERRKLLWKYVEPAEETVKNDFSERLSYFQQHIDAVKENLESLQAAHDKLVAEIQGG